MSVFPKENKFMKAGNYLKISKLPSDEECRIRILGEGIVGWEDWTADMKPVRFRPKEKPSASINPEKPIKKFFTCVVWNYDIEALQVMSITQAKVKAALEALEEKKGSLTGFDIKIIKTGEGKSSQYTLLPCPAAPISKEVAQVYKNTPIRLEALYSGGDPWTDLEGCAVLEVSSVDEKTGEVAASPVGTPLETLREHLEIDKIDVQWLQGYINGLSVAKSQSQDHIIDSALRPQLLPKFKAAYLKHVEKMEAVA